MAMSNEERTKIEENLSRWNQQFAGFIRARCEAGQSPRGDWLNAIDDAVQNIQRVVHRSAHPDDVADARSAVSSLAGIWLTAAEKDALIGEG